MGGSAIHGRARDRSQSTTKVCIQLIDPCSDTSQSVKESVSLSVANRVTYCGPSSPVASTLHKFLYTIYTLFVYALKLTLFFKLS